MTDDLHCTVKLESAIATLRAEDIAREALGVHPHHDVLLPGNFAIHERDVFAVVDVVAIPHESELSEGSWEPDVGDTMHETLVLEAIRHQLGDRHEGETVLL